MAIFKNSVLNVGGSVLGLLLSAGAMTGCDDTPTPTPCEGEGCTPCEGDACPPCEGEGCTPCEGDACPPCEGDECEAPCDTLCDPCLASCVSCHFECRAAWEQALGAAFVSPGIEETSGADGVSRWRFSFDVSDQAPSWLLSAWVDGIQWIVGDTMITGTGTTVHWDSLADAVSLQQSIRPDFASLLVPPGPDFVSLVSPGTTEVVLDVEGAYAPYVHVVEQAPAVDEASRPYVLRVRVISASTAWASVDEVRTNANLRLALETAQALFWDAGIELVVTHWERLPQGVIDALGGVSSLAELQHFFDAASAPVSSAPRDALQVNLVLVDGFQEMDSNLAGYTGALPGPVALHSSFASGVAVSVLQLPQIVGPRMVGQLIAHELGHYLGLQHTSERGNLRWDPMPDTPECAGNVLASSPATCGDYLNLMFPVMRNRETVVWSSAQRAQLRRHPAVTQR